MTKLVAIGDSLTQGFQSGAILKTTWSFPTMIHWDYLYPLIFGYPVSLVVAYP
jgi:hypothetical protein